MKLAAASLTEAQRADDPSVLSSLYVCRGYGFEQAGLALAYEARGDWRRAFEARTAQIALERRLAAHLREEPTSRLRVRFDAEKKEAENRALLREREDAERIRSLQTTVIVLGSAIVALLVALIARSVRKARRLRAMAMTDELTRQPNRRALLPSRKNNCGAVRPSAWWPSTLITSSG